MSTHRLPLLRSAALLTAALAILGPIAARADDATKTVEATGEAAIVNGDEAMAKERATKAALRDAVERTLGTFVASVSQTKDFQLVKDQVMSSSAGFVSSWKVLEAKRDGDTMSVKVEAVVGSGKISEELAARHLSIASMKFPRMAILVSEQNIGQSAPSAWWGPQGGGQAAGAPVMVDQRLVENELIGSWTEAGFTFVDMEALAGKLKAARVVSTNPSADEVREIHNLSDADVIIVGTAVATKVGNLGDILGDTKGGVNMTSCKGSISARVFNADSGEILATQEKSKTALHIDTMVCGHNALLSTAKEFAKELQSKLLESWNKRIQGGSRIRMSVKGVDSFRSLTDLKNLLSQSTRGIQGVDQKSFKDGAADLDLRLDGGDTEALAGDIDGKAVGKLKIHVTGQSSNTITVELGK